MDLLKICRPSAIVWLVVAIGIYAIERHALWPWPSVLQVVLERTPPSLTDANATISVVFEALGFGIFAPADHRSVCIVGGGSSHPVAGVQLAQPLRHIAATRERISGSKSGSLDLSDGAAIAATYPQSQAAVFCGPAAIHNGPFTISKTQHVDRLHVGIIAETYGRGWSRRLINLAFLAEKTP